MMRERRVSQRIAVTMTVGLTLSDVGGKVLAGPVKVELATLSIEGCSVVLPSMQVDGIHLFYGCNDRTDGCLELRFIDGSGRKNTISCKPAWFDKQLDEQPFYYRMGLEFSGVKDRDAIKILGRIARGKSEKDLFEVLGDFFKRQLVRVS